MPIRISRYSKLAIFRPALALALVYCTVLSFGSIMTAYAYTRGIDEATLAIARGVGAGCGLLGTVIFPRLSKAYSMNKTGGISIWLQVRVWYGAGTMTPPPSPPLHLHTSSASSTLAGGLYIWLWCRCG